MIFRFFYRILLFSITFFVLTFSAKAQVTIQSNDNLNFSNPPLLNQMPCGEEPISIAAMAWPSAQILAYIHEQILIQEYGCEVKIISGDLSATISSMATTAKPSVAIEVWIARVWEMWNLAVESQTVRKAAFSYSGTPLEGWYIPAYVVNNHPDLRAVSQLKDYWGAFRDGGEKARFISCPKEWACAILNRNMLKALGLFDKFEIIEPANRFEMDTMIGEVVSRQKPAIFYYWQPNAILTQFNFLQLDMGNFKQEAFSCLAKISCSKLEYSSFASEPVVNVVAERVFVEAPKIAIYFRNASMPIDEMNRLLAWQSENSKSEKETANMFVEKNEIIWREWLE